MPIKTFVPEAMSRLQDYRWPGNVRELENLIQRLSALYSQDAINVDLIEAELAHASPGTAAEERADEESLSDSIERHLRNYFSAQSRWSAGCRSLWPYSARDGTSPDYSRARGNAGKSVAGGQLIGPQPQYITQENPELDIDVVRGVK